MPAAGKSKNVASIDIAGRDTMVPAAKETLATATNKYEANYLSNRKGQSGRTRGECQCPFMPLSGHGDGS